MGVLQVLVLIACVFSALAQTQPTGSAIPGYTRRDFLATNLVRIPFEPPDRTYRWLDQRRANQIKSLQNTAVFSAFQFEDRLNASRISFRHRVVDDAAKDFKRAHYDHGTGIAVADVDGDGWTDIYFVNQLGGSELWRNLGQGRFENITASAGVGLPDRITVAAAFGDIDNDGRPDLFVTSVRMGNALFHNLGNGRFEEISQRAGVNYRGHSSGAVFFDYNRDGRLDLFVCNVGRYTTEERGPGGFYRAREDSFEGHIHPDRSEQSILYQNVGGLRFQDVSKAAKLEHRSWTGDASFCDLTGEGYPDLYLVCMSGSDSYYENRDGRSFAEKSAEVFPRTPWGSMGLKFFDYNQDGLFDLFVTDMHSDMTMSQLVARDQALTQAIEKQKSEVWCTADWQLDYLLKPATNFIFGNAFYRNQGGRMTEISEPIGVETYWPWGVSAGDLNADGFEDLFLTGGMGYPFRYGVNSVLLNDGGRRFTDAEFVLGIEPRTGRRIDTEYFTLDCSGADKENPLARHKSGKLTVYGATSSRSSALFDLDNDGDLDLVVNNNQDRPQILTSNLSQKRAVHFLKIKLRGTTSNADGLGAIVKVRCGQTTFTQYHDGKSGYLSQSAVPLYFGLGPATEVDSVEVQWPSGRTGRLPKITNLNRQLTIVEPDVLQP